MDLISYFPTDIEVKQTNEEIFISQKKYAVDILQNFKIESCKPILTPMVERLILERERGGDHVNTTNLRRLVGSLGYLKSTRVDIVYEVRLISIFMDSQRQYAKRISRYIKRTIDK